MDVTRKRIKTIIFSMIILVAFVIWDKLKKIQWKIFQQGWNITIHNKIQCLSLKLPGWAMSNQTWPRIILACYDSFILASHESYVGKIKRRRKNYNFDTTFLRRQLRKPVEEQKTFHMTHVPSISKLEPMNCVYPKLSEATAYKNQSKQLWVLQTTLR